MCLADRWKNLLSCRKKYSELQVPSPPPSPLRLFLLLILHPELQLDAKYNFSGWRKQQSSAEMALSVVYHCCICGGN